MSDDRNCISYWLPRLEAAGVPVPFTRLVNAGPDWRDMVRLCDGLPCEVAVELENALQEAIRSDPRLHAPCFLRTGHTSGKHTWSSTCHVTDLQHLAVHIANLVEFSEVADFFGLPYRVWAVRELLPVTPIAVLPKYGNMPLVPEMRYFVGGGVVRCSHVYWPYKAIRDGMNKPTPLSAHGLQFDLHDALKDHAEKSGAMAALVAGAFADDGSWSVDVLHTDRGPHVIDMAEAERSWHDDACPLAAKK